MALAALARSIEQTTESLLPQVRRLRRRRSKVLSGARWSMICVAPLVVLLLYVALTAGLTAQTYSLGREQRTHARLLEQNTELRSRVAQLQSVERLQATARALHMTEPAQVALIDLPAGPAAPARKAAFLQRLASIARWLDAR